MHRETLPQQDADLFAEPIHKRLAIMGTKIVHHQMDGVGLRIAGYDFHQVSANSSEERFGVGLVKCGPAFGWTPQKILAAPLVLAIAPRNPSRPHGPWRADIRVQHHRLLISHRPRAPFRQRLFVYLEHVLHAGGPLGNPTYRAGFPLSHRPPLLRLG
jgi:hypothetical protein